MGSLGLPRVPLPWGVRDPLPWDPLGSQGFPLPWVPSHGIPPHRPLIFCPARQKIYYKRINQRFFSEVSCAHFALIVLTEPRRYKHPSCLCIPWICASSCSNSWQLCSPCLTHRQARMKQTTDNSFEARTELPELPSEPHDWQTEAINSKSLLSYCPLASNQGKPKSHIGACVVCIDVTLVWVQKPCNSFELLPLFFQST